MSSSLLSLPSGYFLVSTEVALDEMRYEFSHGGSDSNVMMAISSSLGIIALLQIDSLSQSLCGHTTIGNEWEASTCHMWCH